MTLIPQTERTVKSTVIESPVEVQIYTRLFDREIAKTENSDFGSVEMSFEYDEADELIGVRARIL